MMLFFGYETTPPNPLHINLSMIDTHASDHLGDLFVRRYPI